MSTRQREAGRSRRRAMGLAAAVGAAALVMGACGSSSPGAKGTIQSGKAIGAQGTPQKGGTVYWAEQPAATPDFIFPLMPFADFSVQNISEFQYMMYRPLFWFGDNDSPTVDYGKSVGQVPVWTNHDKTVTVTLNSYTWSDGEKVDARDVQFWMNLLKAEKANWAGYVPGYFPDNVVSVTAPDGPTGNKVQFDLNKSYNPTWFLYNELSQVTPLPVAWDRTSSSGATPTATQANLSDATPAGAKAVYTYLNGAAKSITTYASSPLWSIVDGPWKLQSLTSQGEATFVPNQKYTGTDHPRISKFVEVPFTSDDAEFNSVKAGTGNLQYGYIPDQDLTQEASVASEGFTPDTDYPYAFNYLPLNFTNTAAGAIFKQAYVREALQELIDQAGWIKAYYQGLAAPTYGPVPVEPPNSFADTYEKADPYPFSVSSGESLLRSHGWSVVKGGTDTCQKPGAGNGECGAGIAKGAPLSFTIEYASGSLPLTNSMDDFKSVAASAGVQLTEKQAPFDTVIGDAVPTSKTWQLANWGAGWIYAPDFYASGEELYATGAGSNAGDYSSPQANSLIQATTTVGEAGSQKALDTYQDYIARQLPVLFQPAPASEVTISKALGGVSVNVFEQLDPEDWFIQKP